jgi:hypothetical protein
MDATHARPMAAYAALCAAAVVVLAQGVGTSGTVADAVAQAGRPASLIARSVTLTASEQISDQVSHLAASVVSTMVPAAPAAQDHGRVAGSPDASGRSAGSERTTAHVGEAVTIAPARGNLRVASSATTDQRRAAVDRKAGHKADRKAAHKGDRKAERAAARDARKAHRAARHHR